MHVRIDSGNTSVTKALHLSLNKAAIIDLPVDARDALVSNPKIADAVIRTPRRIYVMGLEVGQTNAFFFDGGGHQVLNLEITVERDYRMLSQMYKRVLPNSRIDVHALNDNIVLSGLVDDQASADQARDLAARFVGDPASCRQHAFGEETPQQVLLKVRIAEMQRSLMKQLGINYQSNFNLGDVSTTIINQNPFSLLGKSLSGTGVGLGYAKNGKSVTGSLQALERDGLIKTLAEPNLTAISGESAKFLAGGEFPIPVAIDQNGNVTVAFKPFGVGLGFTPVVLSSGRISLKISTEVSETTSENAFNTQAASNRGITIPGLTVRRAETTVELPSGGSLVMAGLLQDSLRHNIDGIPGLKDVPVLGALFRSSDYQNNETELVVMVTPYLVKPTEERKIALPTDGYCAGKRCRRPAARAHKLRLPEHEPFDVRRSGGIQGPVGFVMK